MVSSNYRALTALTGFASWVLPTLTSALKKSPDRRLLAIYDLSSQPFNIGDVILIHEASLVLLQKYGLQAVDFALAYEPHSLASSGNGFANIKQQNVFYNLAGILPVAQVNQSLGSVFLFDSHSHLHRFIIDNADRYVVWPNAWKYCQRDYLYYEAFNNVLYPYYEENKAIPLLTGQPHNRNWACSFFRERVFPALPVTVNIRNNQRFGRHRNADIEVWTDFFQLCEGTYPVKFIVICALSEIDQRLRNCGNVLVVKDYHTTIEQEMMLIHLAPFHMGLPSGPVSVAIFGTRPYLVVKGDPASINHTRGVIYEGNFARYCFATPAQRFAMCRESPELLMDEFLRMWNETDPEAWWKEVKSGKELSAQEGTWLR